MNIIGKYYLFENVAATSSRYWDANELNWTTNPHEASFWDTLDEAREAAAYAMCYTTAEVVVQQATKELPPVDAVNQRIEYDNYIDLMHRTGGSFARAIADAFYKADSSNRMRLLTAFDELFSRYKAQFKEWEKNHE